MGLTGMDVAIYGFSSQGRMTEPAGIFYEVRVVRDKLALGLDTEPVLKRSAATDYVCKKWREVEMEENDADALLRVEAYMDPDEKHYLAYLKSLDPKDWKSQDHYRVLGLSRLRWQASFSQIRCAYRAKVLKHHPDKNQTNGTEDYFTCITKAYEQLGLSELKRRAFDSVDPLFDDTIPDEKKINSENFFSILGPVFLRNARWSNRQPVPALGDINNTKQEVDNFYSFWFNWDSWREFSYLDEEDKEKGEDRWERREIEKINKAERERRRKNELKRIRSLVELAYRKDPRVASIKEQEKLRKEKEKSDRRKALEEKRAQNEMKKLEFDSQNREMEKQQLEKQRLQQIHEKRLREQQKKQLAEARRKLRRIAEGSSKLRCLEAIERLCLRSDADQLNKVTARMEFVNELTEAMDILSIHIEVPKNVEIKSEIHENTAISVCRWSADEIALLIKANTLYPAGTSQRWPKIADYVNDHRENKDGRKKTEKDVVAQVKLLKALDNLENQKKVKELLVNPTKNHEVDWTAEKQNLLETALRKFPSSCPDRWDNIADFVGLPKKNCIKRFKYLAEVVKNKREHCSL